MIWEHLRPRARDTSGSESVIQGDGLAILRACQQLNEEIAIPLYEKETLQIRVESDRTKWLAIESSLGASWTIPNIQHPLCESFKNLPYGELQGIQIWIDAPENITQLFCISRNVRHLVNLLDQAGKLPAVSIHLSNTSNKTWAEQDGTAQRSLPGRYAKPDYFVALLPFCRLRNISQASLHVPNGFIEEGNVDLQLMEQVMGRNMPFGSFTGDDEQIWYDNEMQTDLDDIYMHLERELDTMTGLDPNMLRLERFMSWYDDNGESEYVREFQRMLSDQRLVYTLDIEQRHAYLLTFNPLSANMQRMRLQLDLASRFRKVGFPLERRWDMQKYIEYRRYVEKTSRHAGDIDLAKMVDEEVMAQMKSGWSKEAWRDYYSEGIPPLDDDSQDIEEFYLQMGDVDALSYGLSAEEKPQDFARIHAREQEQSIDFGAGEEKRMALESLLRVPVDSDLRRSIDGEVLQQSGLLVEGWDTGLQMMSSLGL
ncbi:uncharacterized protein LY89DRAFT_783350 [Mollisia scopiformis]|uniref:Uncharacterized protein n=1 Tax=Mollisia scopiformis TaxID=149040 RepID=A0A194X4Z7_MOLSC|nr:uncharacterized protein LY89DRAFT_783350 [Mollisia scopiformis]KUJ15144.1 hypothetical protein LY89DRAFT_783350 [Mollisia scopiformis]